MESSDEKLKIAYDFLRSVWEKAPTDIDMPKVLFLFYQNKIYTVVDDSSSVYIVASKDKQILAVAKTKAPAYERGGVKIYNVVDSKENIMTPLKVISCNKIQDKKQKFVIENIVKYI
jgi:hypothetical protein